jgi:hypothetical protein
LSHKCASRKHLEFGLRVDRDIAEIHHGRGCLFCGEGRLHRSDFRREPRGLAEDLKCDDPLRKRLSFCCDRKACRRRTTPPSVRFLGRRLFFAPVVVLLTAMVSGRRIRQLCRELEVDRRTLERWRRWWREDYSASHHWRALRARFADPPRDGLPRSLLMMLGGLRPGAIRSLLRAMGPVTGGENMRGI